MASKFKILLILVASLILIGGYTRNSYGKAIDTLNIIRQTPPPPPVAPLKPEPPVPPTPPTKPEPPNPPTPDPCLLDPSACPSPTPTVSPEPTSTPAPGQGTGGGGGGGSSSSSGTGGPAGQVLGLSQTSGEDNELAALFLLGVVCLSLGLRSKKLSPASKN